MVIGLLHKIAKNSLERPNVLLAVVFFLLPFVFSVVARLAFNFPIDAVSFAINVAKEFVFWIASIGLLYILIRLIKGAPALKFTGLLTGQSFIQLFNFLLSIFVIGIFFFLFPGFFGIMSTALENQQFGDVQLAQVLSSLQAQPDIVLLTGLGLMAVVFFAVLLISVYLIYLLIEFAGQGSRKQNWFVLILWLVMIGVVRFLLP
jgi:hypothetical protein